jgi:chemotaxis protein CheX
MQRDILVVDGPGAIRGIRQRVPGAVIFESGIVRYASDGVQPLHAPRNEPVRWMMNDFNLPGDDVGPSPFIATQLKGETSGLAGPGELGHMNLHDSIITAIRTSAGQVFSTMLGVDLGEAQTETESSPPPSNDGVVSFIGLAGPWVGTGSIACSAGAACRVCSLLLMTEAASVDEDVLDAVAELTNMIVGNVKTELESELGALGLSIPTVIFGKNFKARSGGSPDWSVVRYDWGGEPIVIRVCLAPSERAAPNPLPHGAIASCAVDL